MKFDEHVKSLLSVCRQRLYLLRKVKYQGLPQKKLDIIFSALILSKFQYALPAFGVFLSLALVNQINAFLKRAFKYNLCSKQTDFYELLNNIDKTLFKAAQSSHHCINFLLPPKQNHIYGLRQRS